MTATEADTAMPALTDVTKRYGLTTALDGVSLPFEMGQFHGVIGPNGSGKTTLFRLLAGLARPTDGTLDRGAVSVGYSFQEPRFYPDLTARENLAVFRRLADDPPPASWIDELLAELRLEPAADRRAGDLSGGFRKKLDLGLALVKRPDLLILDEPFADVDDHSQRMITSFLAGYRSAERTIVVSTHDVDAFAELFDRITVLVDGVVQLDDEADVDVTAQYRSALE